MVQIKPNLDRTYCMVQVSTLFNSAFVDYTYVGSFGSFAYEEMVAYSMGSYNVVPHVYAFMPAVLCGVCGGAAGSFFIILNTKINESANHSNSIAPFRVFKMAPTIAI